MIRRLALLLSPDLRAQARRTLDAEVALHKAADLVELLRWSDHRAADVAEASGWIETARGELSANYEDLTGRPIRGR